MLQLRAHSAYSLLESTCTPQNLALSASALGYSSLALTDTFLLTGAVEFTRACQSASLHPIYGLEIPFGKEAGALTLLAENAPGWQTLCSLSSALALRPDPEATSTPESLSGLFATLPEGTKGLIALLSPPLTEAATLLARLRELFPRDLFLALEDPFGPSPAAIHHLAGIASAQRIPLIAAPRICALQKTDLPFLKTLASIRDHSGRPPAPALPTSLMFSPSEMQEHYHAFPASLTVLEEISDRCTFQLELGKPRFPLPPIPSGQTQSQVLRVKAEEGVRRLYPNLSLALRQRLDHELEVIAERGFEPIFLIMEEIMAFTRQAGITTSSRGSAASSLVAHCLGITTPDPLHHDLYFERFLNPARTTPPDIDTDLCSRRRDEVIQHVFATYGEDRVAMVATVNHFRPRSALAEAAKTRGMGEPVIRELTALLPHSFFARTSETGNDQPVPSPFAELAVTHSQYHALFQEAEALLRLPHHLSVHPGGVVIAPEPIARIVPVMRSGSKGIIITQMDLESVEALGLVKIDLLGIRGLTVLGDVASGISLRPESSSHLPLAILDAIPLDDSPTSDRVEQGQTIGCFQIESPGMRGTLREIHARTPEDILCALALYRPGPITGGMRDAFVRRFKGEEAVEQLHPSLIPILGETFGVILYQEQVLRIAHQVAGLSLAEADLLRRAMSHFDPGNQMDTLKEKFIRGAGDHASVDPEVASRLWELMAAFAGYGFPKAHAASYALVSWRSAWCKQHFPAEFMAAVLANWGGYYSQQVYLTEARRLGLHVLPPHINHSGSEFSTVHKDDSAYLYMGLDQVRGLTRRTIDRIRRFQPFSSLDDFLTRTDPRPQEAESLAMVGALEGFGNIPFLLERIKTDKWVARQPTLFSSHNSNDEDWSSVQKNAAQLELLGISLGPGPLEQLAPRLAEMHIQSTSEVSGKLGQRIKVAGVRQSSHRTRTARGESMLFLTLEDMEGSLDVVLFPDLYHRVKSIIFRSGVLFITGIMEQDLSHSEPILHAEKVEVINS